MIYNADSIYDGSGKYFLADFERCDNFVEIAEIFAELERKKLSKLLLVNKNE